MEQNDINNSIDGLTDESVMELYDGIIEAGEADYLSMVYGYFSSGGQTCWCAYNPPYNAWCRDSSGNSYKTYKTTCKY